MGQNAPLFSNQTDFIDSLVHDVTQRHPIVGRLLDEITSVMNEDAPNIVRRYFVLYTIPVLEMSELVPNGDPDKLFLWGLVQTQLGVYIRYADNVVDGDCEAGSIASTLLASHRILSDAKLLLSHHDVVWDADQDDVHSQFLAFESESRAGFHHGFDSLWRRVSPLSVVPETYLSHVIPTQLVLTYRQYLAWSLLHADCDDSLKDLNAGVNTPVTRALTQSSRGVYLDWSSGAEVIADLKEFLRRQGERLLVSAGPYPSWSTIIRHLDAAFSHNELF